MRELENKVIYQIYPKSFLDTTGNGYGDINGIRQKLLYIKNLGVDYIWLSPCCKSPQKDNGYDIADYMKIEPLFGTNEDYEAFIQEAKALGMKVMMDLVLNHTSDQHVWFKKACELDPKYYDYYIWRDEPNEIQSTFGGSAWTYHEKVGKYYFHLFDVSQPDLNWENKNVRKELYDMINYWISKGVEGFRLDVIDLIGKEPDKMITSKGPKFYEYLQEMNEQTFKDKLLTVGECWGSSLEESYKMCNSKGLTQAFHFHQLCLIHKKNKWDQKTLDLKELCKCLDTWQNEYEGIEAIVMNNHDQPRLVSVWLSDREYRKESCKLLITLFGLLKGNLYIYQGEEIGMVNANLHHIEDYVDIETKNAYDILKKEGLDKEEIMKRIKLVSRDNARTPMQWNRSKNAGFTSGTPWMALNYRYQEINVEEDLNDPDGIYAYYRSIIQYRKNNYDMISLPSEFSYEGNVLKMKKGTLILYANFGKEEVLLKKDGAILFKNYQTEEKYTLRAYEVVVLDSK